MKNNNRDFVAERVIKIVAESLSNEEVQTVLLETTLEELNVNSIEFIKIIVGLEDEFNTEFEDEMLLFESFTDISSIVDYILQKQLIW